MKKIPRLFVIDYAVSRIVTPVVTPGCEWVLDGEGVATRKHDGTACMVSDGVLYARFDAKHGKAPPPGAIPCIPEPDPVTTHWPHWIQVLDQPNFKWHREARARAGIDGHVGPDGTYELIGPMVNGNPDGAEYHRFVRHGSEILSPPRTYDGLRDFLSTLNAEGIVFHHPDGRMAKLRRHDFGFPWGKK